MASIWYTHPHIYEFGMKIIHGKDFYTRFKKISLIIGKDKSVLDLGGGSFTLARFLDKSCSYEGWDLNKAFVRHHKKKGLNVRLKNCLDSRDYPDADCITLVDVLHHVAKDSGILIESCLSHAKDKLIICEPYKGEESRFYWFLVRVRQALGFEKLIGDYDGINKQCHQDSIMKKDELIGLLRKYGDCKIIKKDMNIIAIYEK